MMIVNYDVMVNLIDVTFKMINYDYLKQIVC